MKIAGYGVLIIGIFWVIAALLMDVSVDVGDGHRVNNLGLMASKQNHIFIGGFIALAGLLLAIFGDKLANGHHKNAKCPFCAEDINPAAIKCKHCGSDISSVKQDITRNAEVCREEGRGLDGLNIKIPLIFITIIFLLIIGSIIIYRI